MSTPLEKLRSAFMDYVDSIKEEDSLNRCNLSKTDRLKKFQELTDGHSEPSVIKDITTIPITGYRALKLKSNLINTFGEKSIFNKNYQVQPTFALLISDYFTSFPPLQSIKKPNNSKELIFEMVSFSTNTLDFVVIFPNHKKYLLSEINTIIEVNDDEFSKAQNRFEEGIAIEHDQSFKGNIFSSVNKNTRRIFIEYSDNFAEFCKKVVENPLQNKLYLCTGTVSFDLEDLFREESLLNIYNMNQLTLFTQFDNKEKILPVYDDVSPTYPPR